MVGIPGRSKACRTCRRRRKGAQCDQRKPSCGQCVFSRVLCGGYDHARIFINSGQEHGNIQDGIYRFESAAYSAAGSLEFSHSSSLDPAQTHIISSQYELSTHVWDRSLERTACESKFLEVFWTSLLPYGHTFPPQAARFSTTSWTSAIQELYHNDPLVRVTLLANALTTAAQRTDCSSLMAEGRRLYGLSLHETARSLVDNNRRDWSKILAASGLLASYELLLNADEQGGWLPAPTWLRYALGEIAIMVAGGPESFSEGHAHNLFIDYRLHLIYPYIQNYKRCPLSTPKWKTIPWSIHPKSPKDRLLDILIDIPGILEDLATLKTMLNQPGKRTSLFKSLEERCWRCDHQLLSWAASYGENVVAFVDNLSLSQSKDKDSKDSAPQSTDLAIAHLGLLYWTTFNLLSQVIIYLNETSPSKNDGTSLPPHIDPHLYCRKVALLIPYFTRPGVGSYLISFIGFPTTVAASFLARQHSTGDSMAARALLAKAFRGESGKQLHRFLATWPWMTTSESNALGSTGAQDSVDHARNTEEGEGAARTVQIG